MSVCSNEQAGTGVGKDGCGDLCVVILGGGGEGKTKVD